MPYLDTMGLKQLPCNYQFDGQPVFSWHMYKTIGNSRQSHQRPAKGFDVLS